MEYIYEVYREFLWNFILAFDRALIISFFGMKGWTVNVYASIRVAALLSSYTSIGIPLYISAIN